MMDRWLAHLLHFLGWFSFLFFSLIHLHGVVFLEFFALPGAGLLVFG
jgi:hypothetical protein